MEFSVDTWGELKQINAYKLFISGHFPPVPTFYLYRLQVVYETREGDLSFGHKRTYHQA